MSADPADLRVLRATRRAHSSWTQRVLVIVIIMLIFAPLVARFVCADLDETQRGADHPFIGAIGSVESLTRRPNATAVETREYYGSYRDACAKVR